MIDNYQVIGSHITNVLQFHLPIPAKLPKDSSYFEAEQDNDPLSNYLIHNWIKATSVAIKMSQLKKDSSETAEEDSDNSSEKSTSPSTGGTSSSYSGSASSGSISSTCSDSTTSSDSATLQEGTLTEGIHTCHASVKCCLHGTRKGSEPRRPKHESTNEQKCDIESIKAGKSRDPTNSRDSPGHSGRDYHGSSKTSNHSYMQRLSSKLKDSFVGIKHHASSDLGERSTMDRNSPNLGASSSSLRPANPSIESASLDLSTATSLEGPSTSTSSSTRRLLKPTPSPSLSATDTNNNKGGSFDSRETLSSYRRTNFSKSASGSRLVSNIGRPNLCDCLTQDCEKEHSNRRHYIEHYYNSRTKLPSADTSTSTFNISTPLNRLSECDAITKRLLSSPIRSTNLVNNNNSKVNKTQVTEVDKARRASLGTNTMTDQVFLFTSNPYKKPPETVGGKQSKPHGVETSTDRNTNNSPDPVHLSDCDDDNDLKLKQQQGRSLSVCDEETLKPRLKIASSSHSPNLNRAISLACESGSSTRRSLTIIPLFGCDKKSLEQFLRFGYVLPPAIDSAVDHLLMFGIESVGIFRKSGVKSRILNLRQRIEGNQEIKFEELNQNNEFSIYDIADLVKMWFRELRPDPLLTKEFIKLISSHLSGSVSRQGCKQRISSQGESPSQSTVSEGYVAQSPQRGNHVDPYLKKKINSMIRSTQRALLLRTLGFFAKISSRSDINQMTSQNLAICLTPSLCATEQDQQSILMAQKALEYCIANHRVLFEVDT